MWTLAHSVSFRHLHGRTEGVNSVGLVPILGAVVVACRGASLRKFCLLLNHTSVPSLCPPRKVHRTAAWLSALLPSRYGLLAPCHGHGFGYDGWTWEWDQEVVPGETETQAEQASQASPGGGTQLKGKLQEARGDPGWA